jgi:hypothetical protein
MANEPKKPETFNLAEALKEVGAATTEALPANIETAPSTPEPQGGAFLAGDGRTLYKYKIDDQTVVLPKPIDKMTEEDFYSLPISLVDSQAGRVPQNLTVKFADPQWAGHWFNRKAQDGRRVSEAKALGYLPAKREDCEWVAHSVNDEDGAIIDNDLVLMKIHKAKLFLQYKVWMDTAKKLGGNASYKQTAENAVGGQGGGKVEHYFTPQATKEFSGLGAVTHLPTVS